VVPVGWVLLVEDEQGKEEGALAPAMELVSGSLGCLTGSCQNVRMDWPEDLPVPTPL
jgi:hypothetical protein